MTAYQSDYIAKNKNRPTHGERNTTQHMFATAALSTALVANDTVALLELPPYARVVGAAISADQLDTNATPTIAFNVGDAGYGTVTGVAARYFATTSVGRAAAPSDSNTNSALRGQAQNFYNGQPYPLTITATCSTAAATFAAGNLYFRVDYYIDEPVSPINQ
ncbi:MAG: hypothetical protein KGL20_05155 [Rhodospirillales bacterium]|nr:hypothetical protein [Rhodospirillales bacterium]